MYKIGVTLLSTLIVLIKGSEVVTHVAVDIGRNFTLDCPFDDSVSWVREKPDRFLEILHNKSLLVTNAQKSDSGIYSCGRDNPANKQNRIQYNVTVRTPPTLKEVSVQASTIIALIFWQIEDTGGYPISNFTAQYRLAGHEEWLAIPPNHITPNSRQIEVYRLQPNTTYEFRIWATNQLGSGNVTTVTATTKAQYQENDLARRMLAGADNFATKMWAVAVGVVMGTLVILGVGTCYLLYQECHSTSDVEEEQEVIELVPNIILNPGYEGQQSVPNGHISPVPDENFNSETPIRINNNTEVRPIRLDN